MSERKAIQRGDGKWNCRTSVPSGMGYSLCAKPATADPDEDGNPTKCAIHSEAGVAKRRERTQARHHREMAEWHRQWERNAHTKKLRGIVEAIAAGHNDPRGLCQEWLDEMERLK